MKRTILLIIAAFCVVSLASCSHTAVIEHPVDDATLRTLTINLDELDLSSQLSKMRNSVSFEDVQKFVSRTSPQTKGEEKDYEIIPQVDEENDTIFYLVQYEKGWKLIASDRRVQPVLAENEEGRYADMMKEDGPRIWTEILAYEMKTVKHLSDEEFKMPREEQEAWKKLWATYCDIDALLAALERPTKGGGIPPSLDGHYEYVNTSVIPEEHTVDHLTDVKFKQYHPFNYYCPRLDSISTDRAPAGCVAVAGAALLKYLHYHLGVPAYAPSSAYCYSVVGDDPLLMWQGNPSTTIWDLMNTGGGYLSAAPLVANLGYLINTDYGDAQGAGANLYDLRTNAFPDYGIYCDNGNYDDEIVEENLLRGLPVLISAAAQGNPNRRHSFVIDSWKGLRNKVIDTYIWVYDYSGQGYSFPEPDEPIIYSITYVNLSVQYVKMNWCPNNENNNGWYTLTGDWQVLTNDNVDINYINSRKMLYNFRTTNQ